MSKSTGVYIINKILKYFSFLLLMLSHCVFANADFIVKFSQNSCGSNYLGGKTEIDLVRKNPDLLDIKITSAFTCGTKAKKPNINFWQENITLNVISYSPNGVVAACQCKNIMNLMVTLPKEYSDSPMNLYYLKDGLVYGHKAIPK